MALRARRIARADDRAGSIRHTIATKPSMAKLHASLCARAHVHLLLCVVTCQLGRQALTKGRGAAKQDFCANILGAKQHFCWVSTAEGQHRPKASEHRPKAGKKKKTHKVFFFWFPPLIYHIIKSFGYESFIICRKQKKKK